MSFQYFVKKIHHFVNTVWFFKAMGNKMSIITQTLIIFVLI